MSFSPDICVQDAPIALAAEIARLPADGDIGATVHFIGTVRGGEVRAMHLEHYPAMTEKALRRIADNAAARWELSALRIVHRVGSLSPGEVIVFIAVSCRHRAEAFAACRYIADFLKSRAPFWKKEMLTGGGARWVAENAADEAAISDWAD